MKKIIYITAGLFFLMTSCTDNFEKYNENPYGVSAEEIGRLPQGGSQITDLQKLILPQQENSYQMCFDLFANVYAGYASSTKFTGDYQTYNPRTNWVDYPFDDTYPKIYTAFNTLRALSKGDYEKPYFALGTIYRVAISQWLADTYGSLPYSKMQPGQLEVPYDTPKELYIGMCEDLKKAIEGLKKIDANDRQYEPFDFIYGGDVTKWNKYANSLLLRLSIRISKAVPEEAKKYAEYAISNGIITNNSDNALLATSDNPVFKITHSWGDTRAGADITEYMNAYSDPRIEKYFTPVEGRQDNKRYFGLRHGNSSVSFTATNYSKPNLKADSPIIIISAAEVAFLRAEAALKGWNTGGATAKELYETGIKLSFEQWGVPFDASYLDNSSMRGDYTDLLTPEFNTSFSSEITVRWEDATEDKEKQLAKIITQKWIANYPYGGQESWAEWRRTGYPNLLPITTNNSGGTVKTVIQENGRDRGGMQRLPFSSKEHSNNQANMLKAVENLEGPDNGGTVLWWAK